MIKPYAIIGALAATFLLSPAFADDEGINDPLVFAGKYGYCYAKSVPKYIDDYDPKGKRQQGETRIYRVGEPDDRLITTYDWFSNRVFLNCGLEKDGRFGVVVVRVGPWSRGAEPRDDHLAIAFYFEGQLIKSHSTLDIAQIEQSENLPRITGNDVSLSASHYEVFQNIWAPVSEDIAYEIKAKTIDGKILTFDVSSGEIRSILVP